MQYEHSLALGGSLKTLPLVFIEEAQLLDKDFKRYFAKSPEEENAEREAKKVLAPPLQDLEDFYKPDPMPDEPDYPTPDECCGSGCRVCVYDLYEQNLENYKKKLIEWQERQDRKIQIAVPEKKGHEETEL